MNIGNNIISQNSITAPVGYGIGYRVQAQETAVIPTLNCYVRGRFTPVNAVITVYSDSKEILYETTIQQIDTMPSVKTFPANVPITLGAYYWFFIQADGEIELDYDESTGEGIVEWGLTFPVNPNPIGSIGSYEYRQFQLMFYGETTTPQPPPVIDTIEATSGSLNDLRIAWQQLIAAGATKLHIPQGIYAFEANGNDHFVGQIPAWNVTVYSEGATLRLPIATAASAPQTAMMEFDGINGGTLEFYGIDLYGRGESNVTIGTGDTGLYLVSVTEFLVHDCLLAGKLASCGISITAAAWLGGNEPAGTKGVIWNCKFSDMQVDLAGEPLGGGRGLGFAYGIGVSWYGGAQALLWAANEWTLTGKYAELPHIVYIEDCEFSECRHAVVGGEGSIVVFRHNKTMDMSSYWSLASVDQHPYRSYGDSGRYMEVYENDITTNGLYIGGGTALWFNNIIHEVVHAYTVMQGQGYYGSELYPRCKTKVYIFNNTTNGDSYISQEGAPDPPTIIYREPTTAQGEINLRRNITGAIEPFPYPHPARTGLPITFPCPYGDGLEFATQAELDAHIAAVHTTPTPKPSGSAAVGGYTFGGYEATLPPTLCRLLWKLRERYIRKEVHKKLHPLV